MVVLSPQRLPVPPPQRLPVPVPLQHLPAPAAPAMAPVATLVGMAYGARFQIPVLLLRVFVALQMAKHIHLMLLAIAQTHNVQQGFQVTRLSRQQVVQLHGSVIIMVTIVLCAKLGVVLQLLLPALVRHQVAQPSLSLQDQRARHGRSTALPTMMQIRIRNGHTVTHTLHRPIGIMFLLRIGNVHGHQTRVLPRAEQVILRPIRVVPQAQDVVQTVPLLRVHGLRVLQLQPSPLMHSVLLP